MEDVLKGRTEEELQRQTGIPGKSLSENAPPMHPNCRCSVSAYSDEETFQKWPDEAVADLDRLKNRKPLSVSKTANRSKVIKTGDDLTKISKNSIIKMESYDAIVRYFKDSYYFQVEGFEKKDLFQLKIVFSGIDDVISNYGSADLKKYPDKKRRQSEENLKNGFIID